MEVFSMKAHGEQRLSRSRVPLSPSRGSRDRMLLRS